jgi:hypothetical protein
MLLDVIPKADRNLRTEFFLERNVLHVIAHLKVGYGQDNFAAVTISDSDCTNGLVPFPVPDRQNHSFSL